MQIDDKDITPMQAHYMFWPRGFRPLHERLRMYCLVGVETEPKPLWQWRGSMFAHNQRRKPLKTS